MSRIYLDHNATTPCPEEVVAAMAPYFSEVYGNASSIHQDGQKARKAIEEARAVMAKFINASSADEIIFTSGGTESNNHAIKGALESKGKKGSRVVSSAIEHSAVRQVLHHLANQQEIDFVAVPVDPNGIIDVDALAEALTNDTVLVSVMAANNEVGTLQPIANVAALCQKKGLLFHTDAVQAAGKMPIDVKTWGVELMSLSAHKFGGPKGVGVLYVKRGTRMEALIHGGKQEKNQRGGTENTAGIVGMAKAAELCMKNMDLNTQHMNKLRQFFEVSLLKTIPHSSLNGDANLRVPNTANICFDYTDSTEALMALDLNGVVCSNGSACHAGSPEASHVLLAMGLPQDKAHASLRFSLGHTTTLEEIKEAILIIQQTIGRLREKHPLWKKTG